MKGMPFVYRLKFALRGLGAAFVHESSFRFHVAAAVAAITATLWISPPMAWIALVFLAVGLVLAAELINTALEHALDGLHSQEAPFIRVAKDCAAAAVLVLSVAAVVVFVAMLVEKAG